MYYNCLGSSTISLGIYNTTSTTGLGFLIGQRARRHQRVSWSRKKYEEDKRRYLQARLPALRYTSVPRPVVHRGGVGFYRIVFLSFVYSLESWKFLLSVKIGRLIAHLSVGEIEGLSLEENINDYLRYLNLNIAKFVNIDDYQPTNSDYQRKVKEMIKM